MPAIRFKNWPLWGVNITVTSPVVRCSEFVLWTGLDPCVALSLLYSLNCLSLASNTAIKFLFKNSSNANPKILNLIENMLQMSSKACLKCCLWHRNLSISLERRLNSPSKALCISWWQEMIPAFENAVCDSWSWFWFDLKCHVSFLNSVNG